MLCRRLELDLVLQNRDSEATRADAEGRLAEYTDQMELATLDKEVAEEKLEASEAALEAAKEKLASMEIELSVLKEEQRAPPVSQMSIASS